MAERKIIVLLTGQIASGKTTLANKLVSQFNFKILKTRSAIENLAKKKLKGELPDRTFLQKFGTALDEKDGGNWVINFFQNDFHFSLQEDSLFVIDSCRIMDQVNSFRKAYGFIVHHIHLTAGDECLKERFLNRDEISQLRHEEAIKKYHTAKKDSTEQQVDSLGHDADLILNTERSTVEDVFIRAASFLKLLSPTNQPLVDVIIGGQFGSEGKGQIAAHISTGYDCLVRVGGPNAGHTVYEEPVNHVFHLLPSGSVRNPRAKILLGPGTVINVDTLLKEVSKYKILDEFSERLIIDENAVVISNADIEMEQEIKKTIGSTGQGVGAATANNIILRLFGSDKHKAKNNEKLKPFIGSTFDELEKMYSANKKVLLEGTQGTALSLHHGIYPYVTSRDTTVMGCLSEAGISARRLNKVVMVARTYPIRVGGTSGPFLSKEIDLETINKRSGKDINTLRSTEKTTTTKIDRRIAEFSWTLFRKACELNSPTDIAVTFVDYISSQNENARSYDRLTTETRQFIEEIERCSGAKVSLISTCFDYRAVIDRRNWK